METVLLCDTSCTTLDEACEWANSLIGDYAPYPNDMRCVKRIISFQIVEYLNILVLVEVG
jgi:hypothetical protein